MVPGGARRARGRPSPASPGVHGGTRSPCIAPAARRGPAPTGGRRHPPARRPSRGPPGEHAPRDRDPPRLGRRGPRPSGRRRRPRRAADRPAPQRSCSGWTWHPWSGRSKNSSDLVFHRSHGRSKAGDGGAEARRVEGAGVAAEARRGCLPKPVGAGAGRGGVDGGGEHRAREAAEAGGLRYATGMSVRATVTAGRLVLDEETDLPEGTVLDLVLDDEGDSLDESERAALERALQAALRDAVDGRTRPASDLLRELRARR